MTRSSIGKIIGVFALTAMVLAFSVPMAGAEDNVVTLDKLIQKGAEYVGSEECAGCHEDAAKEYQLSTHARIEIKGDDVKAQGCETCHGPGSLHVEEGGGRGVGIVNPEKDPSTCFSCHVDKKIQFRRPYTHPVLQGKMGCSDCHDGHALDLKATAASLEGKNAVCAKCHKDQTDPFVYEHEALREGCTSCHQPHGSINDKMLISRDLNLCLRCHTQSNYQAIGSNGHVGRFDEGTCWNASCHTLPHGSNFDDHFRY